MKIVETPDAPHPAGHYSQAVVHGGLVFVKELHHGYLVEVQAVAALRE